MSASLTGQLAYTPLLTTQLHFQLLFFNFFPPLFSPLSIFLSLSLSLLFCPAQRLSMAEEMTDDPGLASTRSMRKTGCVLKVDMCWR